MKMELINFTISEIVVHKITKSNNESQPKFITNLSSSLVIINDNNKQLLTQRIISVTGSMVPMIRDNQIVNSSYKLIYEMIESRGDILINLSKELANHLALCQTTRNIPDSSLITIRGKHGFVIQKECLILIKADLDSIFLINDKNELKEENNAILGKEKKLYKIGFVDSDGVLIFDSNMSMFGKQNIAQYFSRDFFGCKPEDDSIDKINKAVSIIRDFINTKVIGAYQKTIYHAQLNSYLQNQTNALFTTNDVRDSIFDSSLHDEYNIFCLKMRSVILPIIKT